MTSEAIVESFPETLRSLRKKYGFTQENLGNRELSLSASLIAMLETDKRGQGKLPLERDQLWYIVKAMKMTPADADMLLKSAGVSTLRSEQEELDIQENFKDLEEIWIFARVIRDRDSLWFRVVSHNIVKRNVRYCYFTARPGNFQDFHARLLHAEIASSKDIDRNLECYLLPEELFVSNFAVYNPGRPNMYCCGTVTEHGKGVAFYTSSECSRLFEQLEDWKGIIDRGDAIVLGEPRKFFPPPESDPR